MTTGSLNHLYTSRLCMFLRLDKRKMFVASRKGVFLLDLGALLEIYTTGSRNFEKIDIAKHEKQ